MEREDLHKRAKALRAKVEQKTRTLSKQVERALQQYLHKAKREMLKFGMITLFSSVIFPPSAFGLSKPGSDEERKKAAMTAEQKQAFADFLLENTNEEVKTFDLQKYQETINTLAEQKTQELQQQIIANVAELQNTVKTAKRNGTRNSTVAHIFSKVSPTRLSGSNNYCVAGAICAYENITDPTLKMILEKIIADNTKTAGQLQIRSGHPNLSCHAAKEFFKKTLGINYADKSSPHFQQTLKNLKPGDIILVSSSQNTSSGMHCVTFEKYNDEGRICVKSLNRESDYSVAPNRIVCVAQISNQFQKLLTEELDHNPKLVDQLRLESQNLASNDFTLPPPPAMDTSLQAPQAGILLQRER